MTAAAPVMPFYDRGAAGEHPDWDEYRSVMVSDRRELMAMTVDKVYGKKIRQPSSNGG